MENNKENNLIWVDTEFTGLNFNTNTIVEIAVIVTDKDLNPLDDGISIIIYHHDEVLGNINPWCVENFTKSGLIEKIKSSDISMKEAEEMILDYVQKHTVKGKSPLCGNSVGEDKRVLYKDMREFYDYLHYRVIDVSTIKELVRRWKPEMSELYTKKKAHRAMDDILESIEELKVYRENFLDV